MSNKSVSVVMITFGHEKYIEEAINGVLIQECDFDVELIIADDNSPDNTEVIVSNLIKNIPDKCRVKYTKHDMNMGMMANFNWALDQAQGKYIALCEGDDYWTDPYKLQKQVDFLEANEDYGLVSTLRSNYNQKTKQLTIPKIKNSQNYDSYNFEDILLGKGTIATLTTMFRKILLDEYLNILSQYPGELSSMDYCLWMFFSYKMKVAVLNINTAVYRILPNSASHGCNEKKWNLKKRYYNDFKFYTKYIITIDKDILKKAEYLRAKGYFVLALKSNDLQSVYEFLRIFKLNNDYFNFYLLKTIVKFSFLKYPFFLAQKMRFI